MTWRLDQVRERDKSTKSVADLIRLHRGQQAREVLLAACTEAIALRAQAYANRFG
ncbi:MAG: hypothetical protein QNJ53_05155 [Pleurocapsa sp. MO_192.B19]|nr:hypothetical protein [Pleurocapsa sp. MO_192.B19]